MPRKKGSGRVPRLRTAANFNEDGALEIVYRKRYEIYCVTGPEGRRYVGMSMYPEKSFAAQIRRGLRAAKKTPLQQDIWEKGSNSFQLSVIVGYDSKTEALKKLPLVIKLLKADTQGYNVSDVDPGVPGTSLADAHRDAGIQPIRASNKSGFRWVYVTAGEPPTYEGKVTIRGKSYYAGRFQEACEAHAHARELWELYREL